MSSEIASLDYEQASIYRLVVRAQDSGLVNSMPVYANVLIYLNDVNDNAPQINITLPGSDYSSTEETAAASTPLLTGLALSSASNESRTTQQLELSEYTAPNTFVAQLAVSDADSGANGRVQLDMRQFKRSSFDNHHNNHHKWTESNDFELVHLFNNIYSLMTKSQLDRELFDEYRVELRARDAGQQPRALETVLDMRVIVRDENDNKPIFDNMTSPQGFEFNVTELGNFNKLINIIYDNLFKKCLNQ